MSSEAIHNLSELGGSGMNLKETELTLGLPGEPPAAKSCMKRVFSETVDLELGHFGGQNKKDSPEIGSVMKKDSATTR